MESGANNFVCIIINRACRVVLIMIIKSRLRNSIRYIECHANILFLIHARIQSMAFESNQALSHNYMVTKLGCLEEKEYLLDIIPDKYKHLLNVYGEVMNSGLGE